MQQKTDHPSNIRLWGASDNLTAKTYDSEGGNDWNGTFEPLHLRKFLIRLKQ